MVEMGVVGGAYGVHGWIKVAPWSAQRDALVAHRSWWIDGRERSVESARQHGAQVIARLPGVETPEQARALKGKLVCVPRETLPEAEEGQYYFADLVGMEVVNQQGSLLGRVKNIAAHGAQDVVEVVAEVAGERMLMLPWVGAVVKRVDLDARRIEVDWGTDW